MAVVNSLKRSTLLQNLLRSVIYNKYGIIGINKPFGVPVQGDSNTGITISELLEDFAKAKGIKSPLHLAHRLDRDSTGVLLISSSPTSAQYLAEIFKEKKIEKTYWSVVIGTPKNNHKDIFVPLTEEKVNGRYKIVLNTAEHESNSPLQIKTRAHHTRYKMLSNNKQTCSLLELNPVTGHKHQLRVHLSKVLGTPILGDHKYSSEKQQPQVVPLRILQMLGFKGVENAKTGKRKIQPWQRAMIPLHLHAKQVKLPGLARQPVVIKAPLPEYFKMTLSSLKLDPIRTTQKSLKHHKLDRQLQQLGVSTSFRSGF